jgi:hypothetical protein
VKRHLLLAGAILSALLLAAGPAGAAAAAPASRLPADISGDGQGWDPAPFPPTFDRAAGVVCDFAVHGENLVDQVERHVILAFPDGTVQREALMGDLVIRVTNTSNGKAIDVDAGGSAIIDHHEDGTFVEYIVGPALGRIAAGRSNLPRGLYLLDGVYSVDVNSAGFLAFTFVVGGATDLCPQLA